MTTLVPTVSLADPSATDLAELDAACADHGFFLLRDHGIDAEIDDMWAASQAFFEQPLAAKREVIRREDAPLGYYERELTKRKRDQKEVFDFMQSRADGSDVNQWPADAAFRAAMEAFFVAASTVAEQTLALVYRVLGAAASADLPPGDARTSTVRLNYYPQFDPLEEAERSGVAPLGNLALHHHTDPGVLTLLLQDSAGGLQTHSHAHGWIDVPPQPGTIVVNLGDSMQVWSNDRYRAAVHRVLSVGEGGRYSTPYFYNPKRDAVLEPLSALSDDPAVYRPFTWKEFIKARVDDNFADLGTDDTQIDHYRVESQHTGTQAFS